MQLIPWKQRNGIRPSSASAHPLDAQFDTLVQQFFGEPFGVQSWARAAGLSTAIDVSESADHVLVRAELPGVAPDEIEITFQDGVLTLSGEKRDEQRNEQDGWRMSERSFGSFKRSLAIAATIDESKISAEHKNGVLSVRLPKVEPVKPRKIEIRPS